MSEERKGLLRTGLTVAGNVTGIVLAVKRKSGFWGGVGWFIVGGLAGAAAGYVATAMIPEEKKTTVTVVQENTADAAD